MSAFPNGAEGAEEEPMGPAAGRPAGEPAAAGPHAGGQPVPDGPAGAPAPPADAPAGGLGRPEGELERVAAERDEYLEALRRLQAEFDNYRKRVTRQQTELLDRAAEGLLERLLPVLDAIDLALQHKAGAAEGGDDGGAFAQIASLLRDALARDGLERIDAVGVHFDPSIHDAVAHLPAPEGPATGGPEGAEATTAAAEEVPAGTASAPAAAAGNGAEGGEGAAAEGAAGEEVGNGAPSTVVAEVLRAGYRLKGRVLRPAMVTVQG